MQRFSRHLPALVTAAGFLIAPIARGQLTTFAQFFQQDSGTNAFFYQSSGVAGSGGSATFNSSNTPIYFNFSNSIAGLPADLTGIQNAHLTFTSFTTLGPTTASGGFIENFNGSGANSAMITITRDTPAGEGNGSRTILLQVIFTPYNFLGSGGSGAASASSLSGTVTFASDFLDFGAAIQRDVGLSFSSIVPSLSIGANGFFNSFSAAGTGTFSSDPIPTFIPEPSTIAMLGAGLLGAAVWVLRRRRIAAAARA